MDEPTPNPLDEAIKNIDRKLDERIGKQDEILGRHGEILSTISDKLTPRDEPPKSWLDDDEEGVVTKKELKSFLGEVERKVESVTRNVASGVFDEKANKNSRDVEAFNDFPILYQGSAEFNPVFKKEVEVEMTRRVQRGRKPDDADLMYDATSEVWSKWVRQGRTAPRHVIEENHERENAQSDSFSVAGGRTPTSGKPTEYQLALARKMGMNVEKLAQRIENNRKK